MKKSIKSTLQSLGLIPVEPSYEPFTSDDFQAIESFFKLPLTPDFVEFFSLYGHSCFAETVVIHPVVSVDKHVVTDLHFSCFFGTEGYGLFEKNKMFHSDERIPSSLLIFADDLAGNFICIALASDQFGIEEGKIYLWDRENEAPDKEDYLERGLPVPTDYLHRNLSLLADSFEDFFQRLKPDSMILDI